MQNQSRTPSSILKTKRASQEEAKGRKGTRGRGRRVSFAPDDELETMHLFTDKQSPLPPQDTQPLAELAQSQLPPPPQHSDFLAAGGMWSSQDKHAQGSQDQDLLVRHHQHQLQTDAYLLMHSPGPPSPMDMELTDNTTQETGGIGGFAARGFGSRDENDDSLIFNAAYAAVGHGLRDRDTTHNITDNVPGLSTLVEEDEELDNDVTTASTPEVEDDDGVAMELTGNTSNAAAVAAAEAAAVAEETTPQSTSPKTRRRRCSSAAAEEPAAPAAAAAAGASPGISPMPRRSSRSRSQQGATTPPAAAAIGTPTSVTPGSRKRRCSSAAAVEPPRWQQEQQHQHHDSQQPAPRRGGSAAAGTGYGSALKARAPSLDPTPSPLRRITRSMTSPLCSPELGGDDLGGRGALGARLMSFDGSLTEGFTEGLEAAAGQGLKSGRRSTLNRFAEQQSKWGFVPGEEDTLNLDMNVPGAGGLGDATLHHVYSETAGTGELTMAMKPGQPLAAVAAAATGAAAGMRGNSRRRSSVGRRSRASLAAEVIPEEAVASPPAIRAGSAPAGDYSGAAAAADAHRAASAGAAAAAAAESDDGPHCDKENAELAALAPPAALTGARDADAGAGEAAEETEDMDISMSLAGATPSLHKGQFFQQAPPSAQRDQHQHQQQEWEKNGQDVIPGSPDAPDMAEPAPQAAAVRAAAAAAHEQDDDHADAAAAAAASAPGAAAGLMAAGDADGITTNLLLDDHRQLPGWGHVPLAGPLRPSLGGGGLTTHTGRGSVGSNVLTMHSQRLGHTTQLLAEAAGRDADQPGPLASHGIFAARPLGHLQQHHHHHQQQHGIAAGAAGLEDCTTKLLADSTSASACGFMGLLPQPRAGLLSSTIAGGAPVTQPPSAGRAAAAGAGYGGQQQQQQPGPFGGMGVRAAAAAPEAERNQCPLEYEMSPELGGRALSRLDPAPELRPAAGAAVDNDGESPVMHWQQQEHRHLHHHQQQQQLQPHLNWSSARSPSASPILPVAAGAVGSRGVAAAAAVEPGPAAASAAVGRLAGQDGSEPTLELAAGVSQGTMHSNAMLEDATLDDFALPPEVAGAEERPITMPFSGALPNRPGSMAHTPGGSVVRTAQPITFSDFCQIVDMQFLTHIRRGTSISVCDFAPSSMPQDLTQALQLLSITSSEVAVLEGAMHELQSEMHSKRHESYELEDRLGAHNPPVFEAVQRSRPTQLEQTKHCLVLLKKACRSQTTCSWKQLRCRMEQELANKLAQQQADLDEQLAFVQAKLQKAQQQREFAKAFHADVLKRLAAEEAQQQEAAAARARLACLRSRLTELQALNADRQRRAAALQERVAEVEARRAGLASETAAVRRRHEELTALMAATPQPARNKRAMQQLAQVQERLELMTKLQGWQLVQEPEGTWLLNFQNLVGLRFKLQQGISTSLGHTGDDAGAVQVVGDLVVLPAAAADSLLAGAEWGPLAKQLLRACVAALQPHYSFTVAPSMLSCVVTQAETRLSRTLELAAACQALFLSQPLLTAVAVGSKQCPMNTSYPSTAAADGGRSSGSSATGNRGDVRSGQQQVQGVQNAGVADSGACLAFTWVEPDQHLKVQLLLGLEGLLAPAHPGKVQDINVGVKVLVAPSKDMAQALQQQLQQRVSRALTDAAVPVRSSRAMGGGSSTTALLTRVGQAAMELLAASGNQ